MGKLSSGCDILFVVNNNMDEAIWMGSDLSSGLASYQAIADVLKNLPIVRLKLRDLLKLESNTREVTAEDLEIEGIVHNSTVLNLVKRFSDLGWDNVDLSTKLLMVDRFRYYGEDLSNCIIRTGSSKIIVINPDIPSQVDNLKAYLNVLSKLRLYSSDTVDIINDSDISTILELLPTIVESLSKKNLEYEKLQDEYNTSRENEKEFSTYKVKKLMKLKAEADRYNSFKRFLPKTAKELLNDFLENSSKYDGLSYKIGNTALSVRFELRDVCKLLLGKKVKEATYLDIFANEIISEANYVSSKNLTKVSKEVVIQALQNKLNDLRLKRESLDKNSDIYKENFSLSTKISTFLRIEYKTEELWKKIINALIDSTDDEFSYSLAGIEKNVIYLNNVPRTLELRYSDFNNKTVEILKPDGKPYKEFTIYVSPNGEYYYSRHVLTKDTYGRKYKSREDCIKAIENSILNNSISLLNLIELKTRGDRDMVWIPNLFIPGLVIKSLNLRFSKNQLLNSIELELIYDSGLYNSNNLNKFYEYVMGIVDTNIPDFTRKSLTETINSAEKAACFIYALNEKEGTDRKKISKNVLEEILNRIREAEYEYFVVESVGGLSKAGLKYGFKSYISTTIDPLARDIKKSLKGTYLTLLTPIPPAYINNSIVQTDEASGRLLPSVRLLNDLKDKMFEKLGIVVHIENNSSLEELFKEWNLEMPSDVKGFVKNGEIYINSSNATDSSVFHEFTHLILGVLKAKNYENYTTLVNIVADNAKHLKDSMRKLYKYLAELDLNEEVFAEMFARYMSGRDLGVFLNGTMKDIRKAVDKEMGSIFGALKITEDFYYASLTDIFRQFSYDLGLLIQEGNGLEISLGDTFRRASTWIEGLIKKYEDSNGDVGIYEDCD